MKTYAFLLLLAGFTSYTCKAQYIQNKNTPETNNYDPMKQKWERRHTDSTQVITGTPPTMQSVGGVYGADQLMRMPRRNINSIAATLPGVESRPGTNETPVIRGAVGGTAYFVDGVRVYGALPLH